MQSPTAFLEGAEKSSVRFVMLWISSIEEKIFFASVKVHPSRIKLTAIFCPNFSCSSPVGLSATIFPSEIIMTLSQMFSTS